MDYDTMAKLHALHARVCELEQFCAFLAEELEAEDDDVDGVLEAYHQAFSQRAKKKVGA